jgi:hypothetical protein
LERGQIIGFLTGKRRLRITFEEAHIFDTGDFFGDGEPTWFFRASWASGVPATPQYHVDSCFPYTAEPPDSGGYARAFCQSGDTGEASTITDPDGGRVLPFYTPTRQPLSYVFAEENFSGRLPAQIDICGNATEDDSGFGVFDTILHFFENFPISFDTSGFCVGGVVWNVPRVAPSTERVRVRANANPDVGFRSDVIVTLEVLFDNSVYSGYTDGGYVVSSFPVASNVHIARPPS